MVGRIVEVADDNRHLSVDRGVMVVESKGDGAAVLGRIPLDDIDAVIASAHGISYTNNLLVKLCERGAPFVLCGSNFQVAGMLLSADGHHLQSGRIRAQLNAGNPLKKRIWQDIVRSKISQQASALDFAGVSSIPLSSLIQKVKSGDPENIEAQAAKRYWRLLFGSDFRRDRSSDGLNSLLNYGYAVLRACTARAVVAAGLHPSVSLHHSNQGNPMVLVDDLMEPFRPFVDVRVLLLAREGLDSVDPKTKRFLVRTLYEDLPTDAGMAPLNTCVHRFVGSVARRFMGETDSLTLPIKGLPVEFASNLLEED